MLASVIFRVTGGTEISSFLFFFSFLLGVFYCPSYAIYFWKLGCDFSLRREDLARSADLGLIVIAADRCSLSTWESS